MSLSGWLEQTAREAEQWSAMRIVPADETEKAVLLAQAQQIADSVKEVAARLNVEVPS